MVHAGLLCTHIHTSGSVRGCLRGPEMHSSWHEQIGLGSQNTVVNHTGIQIQEIEFSWDTEDQSGIQNPALSPSSSGAAVSHLCLCSLPSVFLTAPSLSALFLSACRWSRKPTPASASPPPPSPWCFSTFSASLPHLENAHCLSPGVKAQAACPQRPRTNGGCGDSRCPKG